MSLKSQVFTTAGAHTFTVPAGVSALFVQISGSGSGGVGWDGINGPPGYGGASAEIGLNFPMRVTPEDTLSITIAAGGAGWTATTLDGSAIGGAGGDSAIENISALGADEYRFIGGFNGTANGAGIGGWDSNDPSDPTFSSGFMGARESLNWWGGGSPSDPSGGAKIYGCGAGGWEHGGSTPTGSGNVGAAGPATIWGVGPDGQVPNTNGNAAASTSYGAGGGGAGRTTIATTLVGGDGAGGYVAIFWAEP